MRLGRSSEPGGRRHGERFANGGGDHGRDSCDGRLRALDRDGRLRALGCDGRAYVRNCSPLDIQSFTIGKVEKRNATSSGAESGQRLVRRRPRRLRPRGRSARGARVGTA